MKILITGGAGFIGSSLADALLLKGKEIIVLDNFNNYYDPALKENNVRHNLQNPKYRLYRGDICDKQILEKVFDENKIDAVIHIAANAGVRASIENSEIFVQTNISGTLNVLEQMKKKEIKKLVFASSSSVYGNCKADKFSEDLKVSEPISPYAMTKSACEQLIYTYSFLYAIKSICLRFFTVYGPRQRPDLAIRKFAELIEEGKEIPVFGDGSSKRDYTYIDDIINGISAAIDYDKSSYEIINLGGGSPITLNEMIAVIEKAVGKKALRKNLPMQKGDVERTVCDISKAKTLLKFEPKTSFKEGVEEFLLWRKKQNNGI
ncbi:MAG: SDR family NAD(P)-dependent oxidoreductase [Elusimicrobiota bacterium]|jgi:UDP-glucuronate 4-epimerase|nr:SDR family NAD(P)-dependent oxidoreductase [Elusimicrobiota bacterium]